MLDNIIVGSTKAHSQLFDTDKLERDLPCTYVRTRILLEPVRQKLNYSPYRAGMWWMT